MCDILITFTPYEVTMKRTHVFSLLIIAGLLSTFSACSKIKKSEPAPESMPCPVESTPSNAEQAPSTTPAPAIIEAKTPQEFEKLFTQGKAVVLKVSATWCPPCRYMAPLFEKEATTHCGRVLFVAIDADNSAMEKIISKYAPRGFPTFSYFDKTGTFIKDHPGSYQPDEFALEIKTFVEKYS